MDEPEPLRTIVDDIDEPTQIESEPLEGTNLDLEGIQEPNEDLISDLEGQEETEEQSDEDFDFDFSEYEKDQEEDGTEHIETILQKERPMIMGLRSKFSNGQAELAKIAEVGMIVTKYSIQVESYTQDIGVLRKYYGALSELWECIRNIYGQLINDELTSVKVKCAKLLFDYKTGHIPNKVHNNLLFFRSKLYHLKQISNLGFEVERTSRGVYSRAKGGIVE